MLTTLATRLALVATGSLVAAGALAGPALADGELDQSASFNGSSQYERVDRGSQDATAQTFTAGISGELTSVGLGISKNGPVTNLTIEISEASTGSNPLPTGAALTSQTLTGSDLSAIPVWRQEEVFTVDFSNPVQIESGSSYAIVVSTTDVYDFTLNGTFFTWFYANAYSSGQAAEDTGGGWVKVTGKDLTFATYVTVPSPSTGGESGGGSQPARNITLGLTLPAGVQCSSSSLTTSGPWIQLPSAGDCSNAGRASNTNPLLLGWATSVDFPVDIAQRQVDNVWGAYETFNNDGGLTGVFIPAGGYTAVTGDTNLYPIWSE